MFHEGTIGLRRRGGCAFLWVDVLGRLRVSITYKPVDKTMRTVDWLVAINCARSPRPRRAPDPSRRMPSSRGGIR